MEIADTLQNLVECWGPPSASWFDYFINTDKLVELLSANGHGEEVAKLALQFVEQAVSAQKGGEAIIAKGFPNEDIQFAQRKSGCLLLCAMSCFAYLNYDMEYLIEKTNDILSVRILVENFLGLCRTSETPTDALFAEWMMARWAMVVDRRFRIPPPPAKQTVNNPLLVADSNLTKHENIRKMVVEVRTWLPQAVASLEKFIADAPQLVVPLIPCFLSPFLENRSAALNVGILGDDVLYSWTPRPVFSLDTIQIPTEHVLLVSRMELVQFHFANGHIDIARDLLKMVTLSKTPCKYFPIKKKILHGYYMALNVPSPFPAVPSDIKEFLPDQKLLTDDSSMFRRSRMWRQRAVKNTSGQLQVAFRSENAAKDVLEGCATSVRQRLSEKVVQQRFIKSLQRQLSTVRDPVKRRRIDSLLLFLCATVVGMQEELLRCGWDTPARLRVLASQAPKAATPLLNAHVVKMILASENPFWTIVTSFNAAEIKQALNQVDRFVRPFSFNLPEMLAECVLITRPVNELHAVLLAKLNQLAEMRNRTEWDAQCAVYWLEFGLPANAQLVMLTEAVKVQSQCFSTRTLSHDVPDAAQDDRELRSIKRLYKMNVDTDALKIQGGVAFAAQTFARALNADDWDFITAEKKFLSLTTTMAQLLAAYLMSSAPGKDVSQLRKVCDTLSAHITPVFDQISRNSRRDVNRNRDRDDRDRTGNVIELSRFLGLIRNESLLSLLITYFGYLFNRALIAKKRPHLRMALPLGEIFGHESELSHLNTVAVQELLEMFLQNALAINPTNALWLRTAADFRYARGLLNEAGILYMEYLLACRQSLFAPPQDAQPEDLIWRRLRVCLSRSQYFYLAALVCQLIEHRREEEYVKAMELIFSQMSLDAGANYSCLVFDNSLAELLSDVFERNHMQPSADLLYAFAYRSCMNPDGRDVLSREQSRRTQRLLRTLAAQLFDVHF